MGKAAFMEVPIHKSTGEEIQKGTVLRCMGAERKKVDESHHKGKLMFSTKNLIEGVPRVPEGLDSETRDSFTRPGDAFFLWEFS